MRYTYRCYYCKEVLNEEEASTHFGDHGDSKPICIIHGSTAHGLAVKVRELEKQIVEMRNESDPVSRYWYDLQSKHSRAVIDAEQKGYDKGLNDGREHYKGLLDSAEELFDVTSTSAPKESI